MKTVLFVCLCLGGWCCVGGDHCTTSKVQECLQPLSDSDIISNSTIVPTLPIEEMEEHCSIYKTFEDCMVTVTPHCSIIDKRYFEGINDAYHWLCEENFEGYKKYRDCFATKQLHVEGDVCNSTFTERLNALSSNGQSRSYNLDRICHYSKDYLDCVYNAVDSFCGEEAAKWQWEFDKRALEPLLEVVNCQIDTPSRGLSTVTIVIIVMLLVIAVVMVISIAVYILMRNKKRRVPASGPAVTGPPAVGYSGAHGAVNMGYGMYPDQAGPLPDKNGPSPPPYEGHSTLGAGNTIPQAENPYYAASMPPPYSHGDVDGAAGGMSDRASSMVSNGQPPVKKY